MASSEDGAPRKGAVASLVSGTLLMVAAGSLYALGAYSSDLAKMPMITTSAVESAGLWGNVGMLVSYHNGLFFDRFGPRKTAMLAATCLTLGYLMIVGVLESGGSFVWALSPGFWLVGTGASAAFMTATSNERNWPARHRAKAFGLPVAMFGASASINAGIYDLFFADTEDVKGHMITLTCLCGVLGLGAVLFTSVPSGSEAAKAQTKEVEAATVGGDLHPCETLKSPRFWGVAFCNTIFLGSVIMWSVHVGFVAGSLGATVSRGTLVALFSFCNIAARFFVSWLSDRLRLSVPRTFFFLCSGLWLIALYGLLFSGLAPNTAVLLGSVGAGLADGCLFASFPIIVREYFGKKYYGIHFGFVNSAGGIGSAVFNTLASKVYSAGTVDGADKCFGGQCFHLTFGIVAIVCVVAVVVASVVAFNDRLTLSRARKSSMGSYAMLTSAGAGLRSSTDDYA